MTPPSASKLSEPKEAFPYKPPTDLIKTQYRHIFALKQPLHDRLPKVIFDKVLAFFFLLAVSPILLLVKIAYLIEGWLIPENKGPMFFSYNAISQGQIIPKYKIRLIKTKFIDPVGAAKGDWHAFSAEWSPNSRTHVGHFVKSFIWTSCRSFTASSKAT
jgi:lipopolysaccharide/colanic/teichoic acid biosynthesis glycosyltransferase